MSKFTNVGQVDLSATDDTKEFFTNIYEIIDPISSNQYDSVISFFENYTGNKETAKIISSAVLYTAARRGVDIMSVMQEFYGLDPGQLNRALASFINLQRFGTSYLGMNTSTEISPYTIRTIRF